LSLPIPNQVEHRLDWDLKYNKNIDAEMKVIELAICHPEFSSGSPAILFIDAESSSA
jgi:hypothetical protein